MKFDITIKDATAADLTAIANVLNGQLAVKPASAIKLQSGTMGNTDITESPVVHLQQFGRFELPSKEEVADEMARKFVEGEPTRSETAQAPEFDSTGLPWDERIHSSTKVLTAAGTWKKRRGVPELTVDKVEAELRGVAIDAPELPPVIQQPPVATPTLPQLPPVPQVASPAQLPPVPQVARDFNNALTRIQSGFKDGKMNANTIKEISDILGVTSITDINGNAELISKTHALLDGYGV